MHQIVIVCMAEKIEIILNGEAMQVLAEWTANDLVEGLDLRGKRVALELNGDIISHNRWREATLSSGDRVEIVHFVGGG